MRRHLLKLCLVGIVIAASGCGEGDSKPATVPLPKDPIRPNGEVYKAPPPPHK